MTIPKTLMQRVIRSVPTAIIMIDTEGRITLCNDMAEKMFGYDSKALQSQVIDDLLPQRFRASHCDLRTEYMKEPQSRPMGAGRDLFALHRSGREIPVEIGLNPFTAEDEVYVVASIIDITERKKQEQALKDAMEVMARSNRALDEFAYIVSHDLKEPLRGINNYITFLMEDYANEIGAEGRRYLNASHGLAQRMHLLIDNLLTYSRLGHTELDIHNVNLDKLLRELLEDLNPLIESQHVTVEIAEPLPRMPCDKIWVRQLFQNLITNAIKYNNKQNREVAIGYRDDAGKRVFYVRDNGIGIPDKHREKIFRLFKRLHPDEAYGGGAGAGLTIAVKIVERHGGRIWLESAPGEGSVFYFTLH